MRTIVYRFPDLPEFERLVLSMDETEFELGVPAGETVTDGEWVLAIFELGPERRATSAAARAVVADGSRLTFEARDWHRLADFPRRHAAKSAPPAPRQAPTRPTKQPRSTHHISDAALPVTLPPSGRGARVLVVDDDVDIRELVATMLEAVGLDVTAVGSAEEAAFRVDREKFHLMVLDWNLPGQSGLEFCRQIRQSSSHARIPVLFLTANLSSQDMVDAFASGADDYVVKPFRAPELGARIFALLRRAWVMVG